MMGDWVLRYYSEFSSGGARSGARYRVEIYERGERGERREESEGASGGEGEAREVWLAREGGAVLEWGEVGKLDPVQGSSLTLRLVSRSDREFTGLYSATGGVWRVDVLREGVLYWRGWIDPELYEEPYAMCEGYEVEVTASDFGAMERCDFSGSGVMSVRDVLEVCLGSCGLEECDGLGRVWGISTVFAGGEGESGGGESVGGEGAGGVDLGEVYIAAENFYDEDGEALSCREVAEGVLQPLGLRMVQRGGAVHVFDLNYAIEHWGRREVYWTGDDSALGVDRTYNRVRVKLSTYSESSGCDGSMDADDVVLEPEEGEAVYYVDPEWDELLEGFRFRWGFGRGESGTGTRARGVVQSNEARLGVFESAYSGEDGAALVWNFRYRPRPKGDAVQGLVHGIGLEAGKQLAWPLVNPERGARGDHRFVAIGRVLGRGLRVVPEAHADGRGGDRTMLKVSLELLLDTRYNPFEGECGWDGLAVQVAVPVRLSLWRAGADGVLEPRWYYDNRDIVRNLNKRGHGKGKWRKVEWDLYDQYGDNRMWLTYYQWSDWNKRSAVGGWVANKQCVGDMSYCTKADERRGDGEFVPLPPEAGYVMLEIGRGVAMRDGRGWISDESGGGPGCFWDEVNGAWGVYSAEYGGDMFLNPLKKFREHVWWMCYRNPKVELVMSGTGKDAEGDDVEDCAWIVPGASEELKIDTIAGTPGELGLPTSRAVFLDGEGQQVARMSRGGVTDRLERLLIGTAYSQYAERRASLRGRCELVPEMCVLTDASDAGGEYVMLGEVQDLASEESEIFCVQSVADCYEGIEFTSGGGD